MKESQEAGLFKQENEWAFLSGCGILKRRLRVETAVPELKPLVVVGAVEQVVLVAMLLEEKLLVSPSRWGGLRARHQPANKLLRASELVVKLWWAVVGDHLPHGGVRWNNLKLVLEVILVLVGPAVDVVGLDLDHEWPVRVLLRLTILIEFSHLHEGPSSDKVGSFGQLLSEGLASALVVHLLDNVALSVLEEVEGRLAIKGELGHHIGRAHAVSQELHFEAWGTLGYLGCGH